jgi:hypothetical protein
MRNDLNVALTIAVGGQGRRDLQLFDYQLLDHEKINKQILFLAREVYY